MLKSRRSALKTLAGAGLAAPAYPQHQHRVEPLVQVSKAARPAPAIFFSPEELDTLAALVDLIIPRTETPGAADAQVHRIIDASLKGNSLAQQQWRETLAWLRGELANAGVSKLSALGPAEQVALLQGASEEDATPGARAFALLKSATVTAYYDTRQGLQAELGWNANTYLPEFKGCTHPEHQE